MTDIKNLSEDINLESKKKGRKPKKEKMYFGEREELAVREFLIADSFEEKNKIYNDFLRLPIDKMISSIIRTYKLYRKDIEFEEIHQDTHSFLMTKIDKFKPSKEKKAYSYFGTICKNYLMGQILKDQKETNRKISYEDISSDLENDEHFSELPWEKINFENDGYAIDAKVRIHKESLLIPEITIYLIIDPTKEPHVYRDLFSRILDILVHETNHIDQLSRERNPFNVKTSNREERNAAKKSHKYFLLRDEIESMVEGMWARSKHLDMPLDYIFDDYLIPFMQSKYITLEEYNEVKTTWIKHALEKHPDANFSKKVEKIVNSI
jgi:hypothetical protein